MAVLFWAGNWVFARALRFDAPPVAIAFWRWAVALVILTPIAYPHVRAQWRTKREEIKAALSQQTYAEADFDRQSGLAEKKFASTQKLEEARLGLDMARQRISAAQEDLQRIEAAWAGDPKIRAAIFDGGIPAKHPLTKWATPIDAPGVGVPEDTLLRHGVGVTSAFLFGHLQPNKPAPRPFAPVPRNAGCFASSAWRLRASSVSGGTRPSGGSTTSDVLSVVTFVPRSHQKSL